MSNSNKEKKMRFGPDRQKARLELAKKLIKENPGMGDKGINRLMKKHSRYGMASETLAQARREIDEDSRRKQKSPPAVIVASKPKEVPAPTPPAPDMVSEMLRQNTKPLVSFLKQHGIDKLSIEPDAEGGFKVRYDVRVVKKEEREVTVE